MYMLCFCSFGVIVVVPYVVALFLSHCSVFFNWKLFVMGENEELDDDVAKDKKIRRSNRIKKKHPIWTQFVSE